MEIDIGAFLSRGGTFVSSSARETRFFASELAKILPPDFTIAMDGDLGSGKTTFAKGLAEGLGVMVKVKSPSFNVYSLYDLPDGRKLVHLDAYRLSGVRAFDDLLLDEIAPSPRAMCIEWAENVADSLPSDTLRFRFSIGEDGRHSIKNAK